MLFKSLFPLLQRWTHQLRITPNKGKPLLFTELTHAQCHEPSSGVTSRRLEDRMKDGLASGSAFQIIAKEIYLPLSSSIEIG